MMTHRENKVPEVTLAFWIIKIAATTLGETGGDAVSMSLLQDTLSLSSQSAYALGTLMFAGLFIAAAAAQIRADRFHPALYWLTIVSTTTVGTTMADFADRSLGIGYVGGSLLLFALLMGMLALWRFSAGSVSFNRIETPKIEIFYWLTILFSNTLGTALGDFLSDMDDSMLGYAGGAAVFGAALALIAAMYFFTNLSRVFLFWAAFILTRPLGATLGDLLTKPHGQGGLDLSRFASSLTLAIFMIICVFLFSRKAGSHSGIEQ